jgi:hypothetical protein
VCQHSSLHTQILQKTGQIERTVDQDFASEEAKYKVCVHFVLGLSLRVLALRDDLREQIREGMCHIAERWEGLPRLDARYACDSLRFRQLAQLTVPIRRSHVLCAATPRGDDRHLLRCFRQDLGERHGRTRVQAFRRRARYRYQPRVGPCFFAPVTWHFFFHPGVPPRLITLPTTTRRTPPIALPS